MPIHIVCDLIHVLEYLWRGARCLHAADDPAAEQRVAGWALGLLASRIDEVIADLKAHATCLPTDRRDGLKAAVRYLTSHRAFLRYDQALEQGWPIATGVVEGTARYLVGDRLEIAEARWGLAGAEAILKLRGVIATAISIGTGLSMSTARTSALAAAVTRTDTPSRPDLTSHCGRAAPIHHRRPL
ncbi:hypothetical protein AB0J35_34670 [Nonomuraea angiospora]|uniref:hypothetical protein n=1 Tax=Nonomuraea angiospora TaxID=46172 RepID=UPI003413A722